MCITTFKSIRLNYRLCVFVWGLYRVRTIRHECGVLLCRLQQLLDVHVGTRNVCSYALRNFPCALVFVIMNSQLEIGRRSIACCTALEMAVVGSCERRDVYIFAHGYGCEGGKELIHE